MHLHFYLYLYRIIDYLFIYTATVFARLQVYKERDGWFVHDTTHSTKITALYLVGAK